MVKILRYHVAINNYVNKDVRPNDIEYMERNLNEWAQKGWKIISVNSGKGGDKDEYLVFLEK